MDEESRDVITKHELSVSRFRYKSALKDDGPFGSQFINYPYSFDTGLEFNKEDTIEDKLLMT
jgi:hypothetical protein